MSPGEQTRNYYRRQGETRLRQAIIEALLDDPTVNMTVPVDVMQRIAEIVEQVQPAEDKKERCCLDCKVS